MPFKITSDTVCVISAPDTATIDRAITVALEKEELQVLSFASFLKGATYEIPSQIHMLLGKVERFVVIESQGLAHNSELLKYLPDPWQKGLPRRQLISVQVKIEPGGYELSSEWGAYNPFSTVENYGGVLCFFGQDWSMKEVTANERLMTPQVRQEIIHQMNLLLWGITGIKRD